MRPSSFLYKTEWTHVRMVSSNWNQILHMFISCDFKCKQMVIGLQPFCETISWKCAVISEMRHIQSIKCVCITCGSYCLLSSLLSQVLSSLQLIFKNARDNSSNFSTFCILIDHKHTYLFSLIPELMDRWFLSNIYFTVLNKVTRIIPRLSWMW